MLLRLLHLIIHILLHLERRFEQPFLRPVFNYLFREPLAWFLTALINLGRAAFTVERGMRIAQLLVAPVARVIWEPADSLSETARGAGGFGHTGHT